MRASLRTIMFLAGLLCGAPLVSQASAIKGVSIDPGMVAPGQEFNLVIQPTDGAQSCGLQVSMGDGRKLDLRLESGQALISRQSYAAAGSYRIELEGKLLIRGLRSLFPCSVQVAPLVVAVNAAGPASNPSAAVAAMLGSVTNPVRRGAPVQQRPDLTPLNVLVLLNTRAEGVRVTRTLDGTPRVTFDGRNPRLTIATQQLYEMRNRDGRIDREAIYSGLAPDLIQRITREVQGIMQGQGVAPNTIDFVRNESFLAPLARGTLDARDLLAIHPKTDLPLFKTLMDRGEVVVIGEVDIATLLDGIGSERERREDGLRQAQQRSQAILASLPQNPDKFTALILPWIVPATADVATAAPQVCMLAMSDTATVPYLGFRNLSEFASAAGVPRGIRYDYVARDLEDIFQAAQLGKCHRLVLSAPNADKLASALARENISFTLIGLKTAAELQKSYFEGGGRRR